MFSQPFFPPPQPNIPHFVPPFSPITAHYARNSISLLPGQFPPILQQHPSRHRKQISIGGPPKAVLGGPQRKLSPLPPSLNQVSSATQKPRKVVVNLPKESVPSETEGNPPTRPEWARCPLDIKYYQEQFVLPVEPTSRDIYPPDLFRRIVPDTIDVFLPPQVRLCSL